MSAKPPVGYVERLAACICWAGFANPRTDTPYEYWATVTDQKTRARHMQEARMVLDFDRQLPVLVDQIADVVCSKAFRGQKTELRRLLNQALNITRGKP